MNKKLKGFTLVETIIALAVLSIATSAIYLLLSNSTSIISKTEIKSDLQQEAQVIQERLSTIGMQAAEIIEVDDSKLVLKSFEEVNKDNESVYYLYTFYLKEKELKLKREECSVNNDSVEEIYNKIIGKNIESLEIRDILNDTILTKDNFESIKGIKVVVRLSRNRETLEISTMINFRNK